MNVFDALARARAAGQRVALVTVLEVQGDAPSRPGAKLVVADHGVVAGTLGCAEFDVAALALGTEALQRGTALRRQERFDEHEDVRTLELFAEVHEPEPAVLALGGNPVARALAELTTVVGRRVVLVAPGGATPVRAGVEVRADDPVRYLLAAPPGARDAVVLTDHEAAWTEEALRIALASDAAFVGMLGSRRHTPAVVRRLRDAGIPDAHLARLHSPCGVDIGAQTPEEIALSILAAIIAAERRRPGGLLRAVGSDDG